MRVNAPVKFDQKTHEGGPAARLTTEQELRRTVLSCLLWEQTFYEDGISVAERIGDLCGCVSPEAIASLAIEARSVHHLRHVPLLLLKSLVARGQGRMVSDAIEATIQRADELAEFVAIYWQGGHQPLSNPMKKGLARAFRKFSPYQLAKYNRDGAVKLRDVLFLCHAKPEDDDQAAAWRRLIDGTLSPPDTWEVSLSGGADKRETFERLIRENRIGYLALLRNLRNMVDAGCDEQLVKDAILSRRGAERVLPFRYVAAARAVPQLEPTLDIAIMAAVGGSRSSPGKTLILVDVSGSMEGQLSSRSDLTRLDAAATLSAVYRGDDVRVFTFSDGVVEVPRRVGMAGIDAVRSSQPHNGTRLGLAVEAMNAIPHDRLIVITDEQSFDRVPPPVASHAYMINVAPHKNGVGYGRWTRIDGFSEGVLRFLAEYERLI